MCAVRRRTAAPTTQPLSPGRNATHGVAIFFRPEGAQRCEASMTLPRRLQSCFLLPKASAPILPENAVHTMPYRHFSSHGLDAFILNGNRASPLAKHTVSRIVVNDTYTSSFSRGRATPGDVITAMPCQRRVQTRLLSRLGLLPACKNRPALRCDCSLSVAWAGLKLLT